MRLTLASKPRAGDRGDPFPALLASLACAFCVVVYSFILIERKWSFIFEGSVFTVQHRLSAWEKIAFCTVFPLEIIFLLVGVSAALERITRPLLGRFSRFLTPLAAVGYFAAVTAQFRVYNYVKDGISLAMMRHLAGGSFTDALAYVQVELVGLLPFVGAAALVMGLGSWFLVRYRRSLPNRLGKLRVVLSPKGLIAGNAAMLALVPVLFVVSKPLHEALGSSIAHTLYTTPAKYLTDFDRDGYGLLDNPPDFAPFDATRHPYAIEIPNNGIDEDGVGGDLKQVIHTRVPGPWNPAELKRPNVILVILESARADLLDAEVDGVPVMPALRGLSGQRIALFSHGGFTPPSVIAALTGSMSAAGVSLVDRFHALNYRTGVFSAQDEDFGGIAARCHLRSADMFVDSKSFPPQLRMYSNTAPGGIGMPAGPVAAKFAEWCCQNADSRPFFAYVNFQEMHFPYYFDGAPKILTKQPVRRGQMRAENQKGILRTYMNAARLADNGLAMIVSALDRIGARSNTVLMVMGDHGQEIFDHGILGHGTNIDYEEYQTLGKLCNSDWAAPATPVGEVEIIDILHNAMVRSPRDIQSLRGEVLCYMGSIETPEQLGLFTASGLIKYNFKTGAWTRQSSFGAQLVPSRPEFPLIWWWESALIEQAAGKL